MRISSAKITWIWLTFFFKLFSLPCLVCGHRYAPIFTINYYFQSPFNYVIIQLIKKVKKYACTVNASRLREMCGTAGSFFLKPFIASCSGLAAYFVSSLNYFVLGISCKFFCGLPLRDLLFLLLLFTNKHSYNFVL